jgi:filamentous hemagglutinin
VLNGAGSLINKKSIVQKGAGTLVLANGTTLNNASGSTYNIESNGGIGQSGGGTLVNAGTLNKSGGTGTSTISTSTLNNTGTLAVSSGTLNVSAKVSQVSGGTLTAGTWTVTGSSTVAAALDVTSAGNLTTIGAARVTLSGPNSAFTNLNNLKVRAATTSGWSLATSVVSRGSAVRS